MLQNAWGDLPGDQVVALHLNIQVFQTCLASQRKKLAANERIKTCTSQSCYGFFQRALQSRVFRVMPQKLAIEVLKQNRSPRLANSDQFGDRTILVLEVLHQHAAINEVKALSRELHRMRVFANESRSRVITIFPNGFLDALWTDIYAGSPNRGIQRADCSQNDAWSAAHGEYFHAPCDVMGHIFLHPSLGIDLRFQPRRLARVVHDVIDCCGLDHCLP